MSKLHEKIDHQTKSISHRKSEIKKDWENIKETLTPSTGMSMTALGGLLIGFLFLPKKAKLLRLILRAYAVGTSAKQIISLLPHGTEHRKRSSRSRKHLH